MSAIAEARPMELLDTVALVDPERTTEIISSRTHMNGKWRKFMNLPGFPDGVLKQRVPVDMSSFSAMVVTQVAPKTHVGRHSHDGAVLRYIASGGLQLNGAAYGQGDWILIPSGVEYEINTDEGYVAVTDYQNCSNC